PRRIGRARRLAGDAARPYRRSRPAKLPVRKDGTRGRRLENQTRPLGGFAHLTFSIHARASAEYGTAAPGWGASGTRAFAILSQSSLTPSPVSAETRQPCGKRSNSHVAGKSTLLIT